RYFPPAQSIESTAATRPVASMSMTFPEAHPTLPAKSGTRPSASTYRSTDTRRNGTCPERVSGRERRPSGPRNGCANPADHVLLTRADLLGAESHEAAFFGCVRRGLCNLNDPFAEGGHLVRIGCGLDQFAHVVQFVDDLVADWPVRRRLEVFEGVVVVLLHHRLYVEC